MDNIKILGIQAVFVNQRTGFFFSAPTGSIQIEEGEWQGYVDRKQTTGFVVDDEDDFGQTLLECLNEHTAKLPRVVVDLNGQLAYTEADVRFRRIKLSWAKDIGDYWLFDDDGQLIKARTEFQDAYIHKYGW